MSVEGDFVKEVLDARLQSESNKDYGYPSYLV